MAHLFTVFLGFYTLPRTVGPRLSVGGPAFAAPLMLIVLVGLAAFLFVPLSPALTVTFNIASSVSGPTLSAVTWSYAKVTLVSSSGVTKGDVSLSYAGPALTGPYTLTIEVLYNGQLISGPKAFALVGIGTYQARVVYWPRPESTGIPYLVTITATQTGLTPSTLVVSILPS